MRTRGTDVLTDADCVVPVPLHWRREYARGFNQARELARHLGLPVLDALVRRRHTAIPAHK
jgi:predicted amidophosphoribosyltransferase